jgi:glycerophosphoryl diester phosphodiesterase
MFPEETAAGLRAAYRMGAGVLECDAVLTKDQQLVCRHGVCDLHYTTDILQRPALAAKCAEPFRPASAAQGAAAARCCTTDLSLEEFKTLCATMEMETNRNATAPAEFLRVPDWRPAMYAQGRCTPMLSHRRRPPRQPPQQLRARGAGG